jgi:hypothetical protein
MSRPIDAADIAWLNEYEQSTLNYFRPRFAHHAARFSDGEELLARYSGAVKDLIARGREHFRPVDETHNEMCVADAILADPSTAQATLRYEPPLPNTDKTVDFVLREEDGNVTVVDVKTITPQPRDRWDQYQQAIVEGWLPRNVQFILSQEWQGGELWHAAFVARSRFLEHTLELEEKIAAAASGDASRRRVLMFCGEGFNWHQDELEDFIAYYRSGAHRPDDPFSLAESHYVEANRVTLRRSITSFGCLDRRQGDLTARRVNWHVRPPSLAPFSSAG